MNRVKENEEFLKDVARDMTNGAFHTDLMKGVALSALLDISKSLAVIADTLMEANGYIIDWGSESK